MKVKNRIQKSPSKNNNWRTPDYIVNPLNDEFDFNFDPCPLNHDLNKWNGLNVEWMERNFINPPYSTREKEAFVKKAIEESKKGKLCVLLIPVSTSTKLFHEEILPNITEKIRFVKGRIKFQGYSKSGVYLTKSNAMHDSMIIIFDGRTHKSKEQ